MQVQKYSHLGEHPIKGFIWHMQNKISKPNLVTCLKHTPIFKWCVVRGGSKSGHQITCLRRDQTTKFKFS